VLLLHSHGGAFGFKVAEQRPDKVKAIVAIESATAGNVGKAAALKNTPTLMLSATTSISIRAGRRSRRSISNHAAAVRTEAAPST
jgi:pimeloyl-ACP methyl ester carboxylesterase